MHSNMSHNPLKNYFRTPGIHISLPTKGKYNHGDIELSMSNEIAIFPLTAADEMYVNNPDSLLNGAAVERIIQSCAPDIRCNPRHVCMSDVDAIMLASKLVTYGDDLKLETSCPKCNHNNKITLSIREILGSMKEFPDESVIKFDNLKIYLKPYDLEATTKIQLVELNEANLLQSLINDSTNLEDRVNLVQPSITRIVHSLIDVICYGIDKIVVENEEVTNRDYIAEFISKAPASITKMIQTKQEDFRNYGIPKTTKVMCEKCSHEWDTNIMYDPSSFFVSDS